MLIKIQRLQKFCANKNYDKKSVLKKIPFIKKRNEIQKKKKLKKKEILKRKRKSVKIEVFVSFKKNTGYKLERSNYEESCGRFKIEYW